MEYDVVESCIEMGVLVDLLRDSGYYMSLGFCFKIDGHILEHGNAMVYYKFLANIILSQFYVLVRQHEQLVA